MIHMCSYAKCEQRGGVRRHGLSKLAHIEGAKHYAITVWQICSIFRQKLRLLIFKIKDMKEKKLTPLENQILKDIYQSSFFSFDTVIFIYDRVGSFDNTIKIIEHSQLLKMSPYDIINIIDGMVAKSSKISNGEK